MVFVNFIGVGWVRIRTNSRSLVGRQTVTKDIKHTPWGLADVVIMELFSGFRLSIVHDLVRARLSIEAKGKGYHMHITLGLFSMLEICLHDDNLATWAGEVY